MRNTAIKSGRIAGVRTEIRTQYHQNTDGFVSSHCTNLVVVAYFIGRPADLFGSFNITEIYVYSPI
jgi:hypothetical protein